MLYTGFHMFADETHLKKFDKWPQMEDLFNRSAIKNDPVPSRSQTYTYGIYGRKECYNWLYVLSLDLQEQKVQTFFKMKAETFKIYISTISIVFGNSNGSHFYNT